MITFFLNNSELDDNISHMKFAHSEITGDVQSFLSNKKGIFSVIFAGESATGHVDIYTGIGCASRHDCNVNSNSIEINLWILID